MMAPSSPAPLQSHPSTSNAAAVEHDTHGKPKDAKYQSEKTGEGSDRKHKMVTAMAAVRTTTADAVWDMYAVHYPAMDWGAPSRR